MKSNNRYLKRAAVLFLVVVGSASCGPISAFSNVRDANIEIEKAKAVGADKLAIYQFVSAQQYLAKAREEQGYADYQVAVDLAQKALEFAQSARKIALTKGQSDEAKPTDKGASPQQGKSPAQAAPPKPAARPAPNPQPVAVPQNITPAGGNQ